MCKNVFFPITYVILYSYRGGITLKKTIILFALILLLAACNSPQESGSNENESNEQENQVEEPMEKEEEEMANDTKEESSEVKEDAPEETNPPAEEEEESNQSSKIEESDEADKHQELVDLAYDIFDAQDNEDYDFLQSVLSKGTKLDKDNNKFIFENVTYPHEQTFLTDDDLGELEIRYTHEEREDEVIVGFGAINYEEESSFTIDFVFVRENGDWKMNDMDINK